MVTIVWFNFAVALGLGLFIGLERERSKGEGPTRRPAGIRTFGLTSLLGAIAIHVGGVLLLVVVTGGVIVLATLSHLRARDEDPGLTTEIGLVTMPLLGAVAMSDSGLASSLGVAVAVVFAAKAPLHGFVRRVLTDAEVNDGLVFAVATVVILPQLPDRYVGPLDAINPHSVWLLVVLLLALGACGHIATRALGQRFGFPIAGLASGFVSSTATIGSMASRAAKDPGSTRPAVAGAALSSVATFVQMALLLITISEPTLALMAPALAAGMIVATIYGLAFLPRGTALNTTAAAEPGRAFSIGTTLGLATTMVIMLLVAAALRNWLGETGIIAGAIIAGFVDTHSAAISVASLTASARLTPMEAVLPILAAMTSNALAKIVMAVGAGAPGFALRIVPGIVLSMAAAWAVAMPMILR